MAREYKGNSSSAHADNRKKDILILDRSQINELHVTTIIAETEYSLNFI